MSPTLPCPALPHYSPCFHFLLKLHKSGGQREGVGFPLALPFFPEPINEVCEHGTRRALAAGAFPGCLGVALSTAVGTQNVGQASLPQATLLGLH